MKYGEPDHWNSTKILHQILDTIAYEDKSDNVILFQLYPIIKNPMTQPITKVFKSHLFGLFLDMGILFQYLGTSLRCKNDDQCEKCFHQDPTQQSSQK